eukprot:GHVH01005065.1.p1 GENE.GHVH01005065.1~~GHVH01005065.1.p1  ORF type:complete len:518 (+),score=109.40 GHVH01005065.1:339-1892(+)
MEASKIRELLRLPKTLYKILGVSDGASPEEIKKAYRQLVLVAHPDKIKGHLEMTEDEMEICRAKFHQIQEAYEVLSDVEIKRQYDSGLPFNVAVPKMSAVKKDFYKSLAPVFKTWSRFSGEQPVPELGDATTDIATVKAFYTFWFSFQSTRDYSQHDEYDLKDSSCRDEKIAMENENKKIRGDAASKDRSKLKELLELARSKDPRLEIEAKRLNAIAAKARKEAEDKERSIKAADAAKRLALEIAYRDKKLNEEQAREDKHRLEQMRIDDLIKAVKDIKAIMKSKGVDYNVIHPVDIESMIDRSKMSLEDTQALLAECSERDVGPMTESLLTRFLNFKEEEAAADRLRLERKMLKSNSSKENSKVVVQWTPEEQAALGKAINKFPGGTADRWGVIATFIGTKTRQEVLAKTTELCRGRSLNSLGTIPVHEDTITKSKIKKLSNAGEVTGDVDTEKLDADTWTAEQQKELQSAMKTFPASLPAKDRWISIGQSVEGKNAKQCLDRFKEIKAKLAATSK